MAFRLLFFAIAFTFHCAGGGAKTPQEGYARIVILNYANRTGSGDFDYLSESLGEATRTAMKSRFEYREVANNDTTLFTKTDDQIAENIGTDGDVLILGSYQKALKTVADRKKSETLLVSGKIYSLRQKKIIAEYSKTALVDARIFTTVNEIAKEAVESIQAYIQKINAGEAAARTAAGKEALTLERLKLKVFVPPMF